MIQSPLISQLFKTALASVLLVGFSVSPSQAASPVQGDEVQIGDFRIGATDFKIDTECDPGNKKFETRTVLGTPVRINSKFSVASQNADGTTVGDAGDLSTSEDVILRTYSSVTRIRNLSRFKPSAVAGEGAQRIGMAQWSFDLSPLETHLKDNAKELKSLDISLITKNSDAAKKLDVYLSYTLPAKTITIASIDSTKEGAGATNWKKFYLPARGAKKGEVVGGTHQILSLGTAGNLKLKATLLELYELGVRDFNLSIAGADFLNNRNIDIAEGSGISFETK